MTAYPSVSFKNDRERKIGFEVDMTINGDLSRGSRPCYHPYISLGRQRA